MAQKNRTFYLFYLAIFVSDSAVEFLAVDNQVILSRLQDAAFEGNRSSRIDVISRHHPHGNSGPLAFPDSFRNLDTNQN